MIGRCHDAWRSCPVSHKKSPPAAGKDYTQLLQDDSGSFFVNVVMTPTY
ncbi:hypothetical protein ATN83_p10213 (plasmid) [Raoultella ornithinolytica]|uniref:Uncharacterized protein n=1 Tax=Leclercia adecarboxylata TaxID=83655 RepID=A0A7G5F6A0_9ENTR|nr:hypothetical protein ATN83_p10213 [Raoultella ornithinolytica]QMV81775.1 hypothetical protein [Leclercia adecarboxylata]